MYRIILFITILLSSWFAKAQITFESEMSKALELFHEAQSEKDRQELAQHFDRIAQMEPQNWLPVYYSILLRTINAFSQSKSKAIQTVNELENHYQILQEMEPHNSEVLTLRALFRSVKVFKDPEIFRMPLSGAIIKDYDDAVKMDSKNPRPLYLMAEFNMKGAHFWGKDPKAYCSQIQQAKALFQEEKRGDFEPNWGESQTDDILKSICKI